MELIHKKCTPKDLEIARKKGRDSAKKGLHRSLNPYGRCTMDEFIAWENGYDETHSDRSIPS